MNYYRFFWGAVFFLFMGLVPVKEALLDTSTSNSNIEPVQVFGKDHPLVGVIDVLLDSDKVIVLTNSFPAIHVFTADGYSEWGREGNGPSELNGPMTIAMNEDTLFVLNFQPGACKVVSYTFQGNYIDSQPIRNTEMCYGLRISNGRQIVEVGEWGSPKKKLIQINKVDKNITEFEESLAKRISIPGGPMNSFRIRNPFIDEPTWSVNQVGDLILWNGKDRTLLQMDIVTGKATNFLKVKEKKIPIRDSYVDNWINSQYPTHKSLFGKDNFYENVRKAIKSKIEIPDYFPLIKNIAPDPNGGIWIQRAYYRDEGEIWSYLTSNNEYEIDFPEKRKVMAFGKSRIVTLMNTKNGEEIVEIYNRNDFLN